ncbi:MAG: SprT-like domain-containing protein [Bacteroidales bacterium]|nr:SprT-like domain-containing protein [Bacteroidales bacterium]MDD4214276.1 SprT-like domain-containing protein [Bacteroidales bacterium]
MDKENLWRYLPDHSYEILCNWLEAYSLQIKITRERNSKTGDYRPPDKKVNYHRISVNNNLNPYNFLITLVHEYAHLLTWVTYRNKVKPHGNEWKTIYYNLLFFLLSNSIFPKDIEYIIAKLIARRYPSEKSGEQNLARALSSYNSHLNNTLHLEDLPENVTFKTKNNMSFTKGPKIRTRYKCFCLDNRRWYYVSALMPVLPKE